MTIEVGGISFSHDAIEAMKNGETIGGVVNQNTRSFTPSHSVQISGYDREIKPRVRDGEGNLVNPEGARVTAPRMDVNNSNHEKEMARVRAEQAAANELLREQSQRLAPSNLISQLDDVLKRLAYLERQNKKLIKHLSEHKANG